MKEIVEKNEKVIVILDIGDVELAKKYEELLRSPDAGSYSDKNRNKKLLIEDHIVGNLTEIAYHYYLNKNLNEWIWLKERQVKRFNENGKLGDSGCDFWKIKIDVKGCLTCKSNQKKNLYIPKKEFNKNTTYARAKIDYFDWMNIEKNNEIKVSLIGFQSGEKSKWDLDRFGNWCHVIADEILLPVKGLMPRTKMKIKKIKFIFDDSKIKLISSKNQDNKE